MQQQFKRMYLMATRHNDFITQRTASKYFPLKKDSPNYDILFELNKNLKEVSLNFDLHKDKSSDKRKIKGQNEKCPAFKRSQQKSKSKSPKHKASLLQIYKSNRTKNAKKDKRQNQRLIKNNTITIIENDSETEQQKYQQRQSKSNYEKQNIKNMQEYHIQESQLDQYIDQYLQQIVNQKTSNIREQIQLDRQLFIEKAIKNIKTKIRQQKGSKMSHFSTTLNESQQKKSKQLFSPDLIETKVNIKQKNKSQQNIKQSVHAQKYKSIKSISNHEKYKRKCKSTQFIPAHQNSTVEERILPFLKSHGETQGASLPHRSIYSNTPSATFIRKVGKTFYLNELNTLNRTLELQAKNRERAQRFFRRKLINIEKQHQKMKSQDNKNINPQHIQNSDIVYNFY